MTLLTLSRPPLTCTVLTDAGELERLTPAWLDLLGRCSANEPVLSPTWMLRWWRVFGSLDGRRLCTACFFEEDRLIGLAPLLKRRWWYRPGIPFRRLEPLGTGEQPADAIYPEYLGILAERGAEAEVAAALAEALTRGQLGGWDELVLPLMSGDNPLLPFLVDALRDVGLTCRQTITASASYVPLPASWEEYLEQLSASHRAYVRQSLRRFERWAGEDVKLHEASDAAGLAEGKRVLAALHQERWGQGAGKFGSRRFAAFHDAIMPMLQEAGALELLWLTVRSEPVAAAYNLVWNGKVYFYQSGRKKDVPSGIRPGIVLHTHAIRKAIAAGRREYDFLSGGEQYKGKLAVATRPVVEVRAARPSFVEQMRQAAAWGIGRARAARDWLRSRQRPTAPADSDEDSP
jgi:CelD/BcsL family acetyltransferase involved in cellulose biosynthesis